MKLHLPKTLLVAVLAACGMMQTTYGASAWGGETNKSTAWYEIDDATLPSISAYDKDGYGAYQIKSYANTLREVEEMILASGKTTTFMNRWQTNTNLNLVVDTLSFGEDGAGSGDIVINANQNVTFTTLASNSSFGTLTNNGTLAVGSVTFGSTVTNNGTLNIGTAAAEGVTASTTTIKHYITNSGTLSLSGDLELGTDMSKFDIAAFGEGGSYSYDENNGFFSAAGNTYYLVKGNVDSITLNTQQAKLGEGNVTLEKNYGGVVFTNSQSTTSGEFYITKGELTRSVLITDTTNTKVTADTKFIVKGEGTLALSNETMNAELISLEGSGKVTLADDATLTDVMAVDDSALLAGISGSGTIEVTSNTDWGTAIAPGEDFTGTLYVKTGKFTLDTSNIGKTLKLGSGAHFQMNAACTLASDQEIILTGTHEFHINSGAPNDDSFTISGTISGDGTLVRKGNGSKEVNITGDASVTGFENAVGTLNVVGNSTVAKLTVSGGTVDINTTGSMGNLRLIGGETVITGNLSIGKSSDTVNRQTGIYAQHTGTLNIGDGTTVTKVIATRLESGDADPNDTNQTGGIINVADKASLVITAHGDTLGGTGNYQEHGLMLGAWGSPNTPLGQASTLNVSGDFLAQNIQAAAGDSTAIVNIESGGKVAVKGITSCVSNKSDVQLNLKDGGTLILGENGIHNLKNLTGSFAAGTVGITADASIAENISLCSETGTTFDTTKYVWSTDGTSIEKGTEGGMLTISGVISDHSVTTTTGEGDAATSTTTTYNGKLVKDGLGTLTLQGANTYTGGTEVKAGMLIASTGAGLSSGGVTVKGGSVEVTDAGDGAKVVVGKSGSTDATFVYNGAGSASGGTGTTYSVGNAAYSINNAAVEVSNENGTTISNRLQGVALSNTGTGLLTAGNGYNNLTEVIAGTGDINLTWFAEQAMQGTVTNLTIGAGRTVGVYTKATGSAEQNITVSSLTAGSGATLNANLILTTGASLKLDGALAMGSTLTLGTALTLDDATRQAIMGLSAGEKHALFTGVDALTLNGTTYNMGTVLDFTDGHDLGTYFVLADAGTPAVLSDTTAASGYYLGYTAEGTVYAGKVIPEPTTATLSLLALAALAARRRRK